eukprot:125113-Pyramimonas_sp.AAC.1
MGRTRKLSEECGVMWRNGRRLEFLGEMRRFSRKVRNGKGSRGSGGMRRDLEVSGGVRRLWEEWGGPEVLGGVRRL